MMRFGEKWNVVPVPKSTPLIFTVIHTLQFYTGEIRYSTWLEHVARMPSQVLGIAIRERIFGDLGSQERIRVPSPVLEYLPVHVSCFRALAFLKVVPSKTEF